MKDELAAYDTVERLKNLMLSQFLPARAQEQGERLIERLGTAVRVVLLGSKGVGKTQLLSAIVGQQVSANSGCALALSYGDASDQPMVAKNHAPRNDTQARSPDNSTPVEITHLRLSLPILENIQFLDVSTPDQPAKQSDTIQWALNRADIVLWCTQTFDASEASYWAGVPDHLKDHSFLVLTKAGNSNERCQRQDQQKKLEDVALNEFHRLFVTETTGFTSTDHPGPASALDTCATHGVDELRSALINLAETGHRALRDAALLLVERYEKADLRPTVNPKSAEEKPETSGPDTKSVLQQTSTNTPDELNLYSDALTYLNFSCREMHSTQMTFEDQDARSILDRCLETCEALADKFIITDSYSADYQRVQADVAWAADKMLLIAMEEGLGPATDAATILLQIKRELEARVVV